ncbi:MAG: hypothetical protein RJA55_2266 [Acidobacteriota bacterium]
MLYKCGLSRLLVLALVLVGVLPPQSGRGPAPIVPGPTTPIPGFFDLPVTGGTATYTALGLEPEERGVALAILARALHGQAIDRGTVARLLTPVLGPPGAPPPEPPPGSTPITIAAPLSADHWRDVLNLRGRADLFPALLANRPVLLVCAATLAAHPSLREWLNDDRGLLRWLVRTAPGAYTTAARGLRIEQGRIAVPGGAAAVPIWEALAGEKVARPAEFIRALLVRDAGRLAWLYGAAALMSPDRLAAVLGPGPVEAQIEQARAMLQAFRAGDQNWKIEEHPFLRSVADAWMVTTQIDVANGQVAAPNAQWLWETVFDRTGLTRREATAVRRTPASPVTLTWLAAQIASTPPRERRERFETVRFAQTVFGAAAEAEATDVLMALSNYRRFHALLVTLDRIGVRAPRTYTRAIEAAQRLDQRPRRERRQNLVAFQGAVALVERARVSRALSAAAAEQLLLSFADAVDRDQPPAPAIAGWLTTVFIDRIPPLVRPDRWTGKTAYESKILQALAGPGAESAVPAIAWEGLQYRLDIAGAEHQRIRAVREQLESPGLDAALASGRPDELAEALIALVYAPALGDPDGPALLGADIITRHDFGLDAPAATRHAGRAWALPREQVGDGQPWRVQGSLLGLDISLARLALRRLSDNDMPVEPTINLNDQLSIARTISAMNPGELTDTGRDRIVEALERGRRRVAAAAATRQPQAGVASTNLAITELLALAAEAHLSAGIRETLAWLASRSPESIPAQFALRDLLWLGKPELSQAELDRWGVYSEGLTGRLVTAMPRAAEWEDFGGRPEGGVMGTQSPDLVLRLILETARLTLPGRLVPSLLTLAAQDYWHDVSARFPDDWPAMARQALALSPSRVEDYVAALAGNGPLRSQ